MPVMSPKPRLLWKTTEAGRAVGGELGLHHPRLYENVDEGAAAFGVAGEGLGLLHRVAGGLRGGRSSLLGGIHQGAKNAGGGRGGLGCAAAGGAGVGADLSVGVGGDADIHDGISPVCYSCSSSSITRAKVDGGAL